MRKTQPIQANQSVKLLDDQVADLIGGAALRNDSIQASRAELIEVRRALAQFVTQGDIYELGYGGLVFAGGLVLL